MATILERVKDLRGANLVIFDVHGEYAGLSYASTVKIGNDGMNFPVWFLSLKDLYGNLLKIKEDSAQVQVAALRDAFYKAPVSYTHLDVYKRQVHSRVKNSQNSC